MDNGAVALSREEEILEVMRTTNLLRVEAAALVARRHGEDVSDILGREGPLTREQKRQLGMGRSLADFVKARVTVGDDIGSGSGSS